MEASNPYYENIVEVVNDYMKEINKLTGRFTNLSTTMDIQKLKEL